MPAVAISWLWQPWHLGSRAVAAPQNFLLPTCPCGKGRGRVSSVMLPFAFPKRIPGSLYSRKRTVCIAFVLCFFTLIPNLMLPVNFSLNNEM